MPEAWGPSPESSWPALIGAVTAWLGTGLPDWGARQFTDWALPRTRWATGSATVQPEATPSAEAEMLTPKVTPITIGTAHPSSKRRSRQ